jgi:hypothetical protein
MTTIRGRHLRHLRPIARVALLVAVVGALVAGVGHMADGKVPDLRRPGEPLVQSMVLAGSELDLVVGRARAVARALGIPGEADVPRRRFEALDRSVIDEVALRQSDGRILAVIRLDADRGGVRSLVRIGWSADDDQAQIVAATAAAAASRYAQAAGFSTPMTVPLADWDETMRAWQVTWPRLIDGVPAPGEGLTVWVYRGGRLAALRRIETPAASAPLLRIAAERAQHVAISWAIGAGIPEAALSSSLAPTLAWVAPDDFASRGGADATEARLYLVYSIQLTIHAPGGDTRELLLFIDAGSGAIIGGAETV